MEADHHFSTSPGAKEAFQGGGIGGGIKPVVLTNAAADEPQERTVPPAPVKRLAVCFARLP